MLRIFMFPLLVDEHPLATYFFNAHHGTSFWCLWSITVAVKRWNPQAERTTVSELSDRQGEPNDRATIRDSKSKKCAVIVGVIAE